MSDCRFGVSPVNYPDPDPDPDDSSRKIHYHSADNREKCNLEYVKKDVSIFLKLLDRNAGVATSATLGTLLGNDMGNWTCY